MAKRYSLIEMQLSKKLYGLLIGSDLVETIKKENGECQPISNYDQKAVRTAFDLCVDMLEENEARIKLE